MSMITDMVLIVDFADRVRENPALWAHIQSYGDGTGDPRIDGRPLLNEVRLDEAPTAGGKVFTTDLYAAAHNHFGPHRPFVEHLRAAPWKEPDAWMLFVEDEVTWGPQYFWQDGERVLKQ